MIAYSDAIKVAFGVDAEIISKYGDVSPEVAEVMAETARTLLKADIGISSTATGETEDRPMGMAYIGIADGKSNGVVGRPRRKQHIASTAMFELREWLLSID